MKNQNSPRGVEVRDTESVLDALARLADRCAKSSLMSGVFRALVSFAATQTGCNSLCVSFQGESSLERRAVYVWLDGVETECHPSGRGRTIEALPSMEVTIENVTGELGFGVLELSKGGDGETVCSRLTAPMLVRGSIAGTVELQSRFSDYFTNEHAACMRVAANLVATAIDNLLLAEGKAQQELQLRQSQTMETVGHLAGGVAHDFNNLTNLITGYAELALQRLRSGDDQANAISDMEEIKKAADRASSLTHQLLALGRQEMSQPKRVDLNQLVSDMAKMLGRLIGEHIQLKIELAPNLGAIKAPHGQIEQVLLNLVVNARDAMPRGGKLVVSTSEQDLKEPDGHRLPGTQPGPHIVLSVSDSGVGMDHETSRRIFEPFFTTKGPGKGTGLGLSTVRGIVKQNSGAIQVSTSPGKGATFKVYLPRASATEGLADLGEEGKNFVDWKRGKETLLIVEDEESLRRLIQKLLESSGYTVLAAGCGQEALEVAAEFAGDIDLMIADVVLPETTGHDLARKLSETRPDTSVLYISGYNSEALRSFGFEEQGVSFLQKPFSAENLAITVRDLLDLRLPSF